MALDGDDTSATVYLDDLNPVNPAGDTYKSDGDDHLRFIKRVLVNTFPNVKGIVLASHTELSYVDGVASQLAGISDTATLTNKTLTSPTIQGGTLANTVTVTGEFSVNSTVVTPTEMSYLDGASANIQTQLNSLLPKAGGTLTGDIDFDNNDLAGLKTATWDAVYNNGSSPGATPTFNWNNGMRQKVELNLNVTSITLTAPPGPGNLLLVVNNPGGRTVAGWPSAVDWGDGGAPTFTAGRTLVMFFYDGTTYYGTWAGGYA